MRRIRTRIMAACLLAALLPAIPATLLVRDLLARSLNPELQTILGAGLQAGLEESRQALRRHKREFTEAIQHLPADRIRHGGFVLLNGEGEPLRSTSIPGGLAALADELTAVDQTPRQLGGYLAVRVAGSDERGVIVAQALPADLVARAERLTAALRTSALFEQDRGAILRSYALPFLVVYGALALLAVGLAALLARGVVRPLEAVSQAARTVAAGDLNVRVDERAPGEAGDLARAFNEMVADLARQRRELARLEKLAAWRTMARMLAHEVKNPLTPILLSVQEARRSYAGGDANHRTVLDDCESIVSEEVQRLRDLVRSFSDFARLPAPMLADADLGPLVADLARLYGERLQVQLPAGSLTAHVDPGQIRRALVNLVDNGLAACRRAGRPETVALTVTATAKLWSLAAADKGDGITPEHRDRIFEPDFTTDGEGLGLGLPIVDGIIAAHGGTIAVDSTPGSGTTFTLTLPRARTDEEAS